jgi:hypothetical protein
MARTCFTARKSSGHQPTGQLAPHDLTPPQLQECQPDTPQLISQEEEPFEKEIVVPESPEAQGAPAEEPKQ